MTLVLVKASDFKFCLNFTQRPVQQCATEFYPPYNTRTTVQLNFALQ